MIDLTPYLLDIHHKPIAVFGLGKSGSTTIQALTQVGATVMIGDDDPKKVPEYLGDHVTALDLDFSNLSKCGSLILSPGIPLDYPTPHPVVTAAHQMGIEIIGDIELFARARTGYKTIGVTGTNGKSTTTALIAHILNASGKKAIPCGNIGDPILSTNPMSDTIYVIELSSFQIDLCPTFRPDISIHLNITPDHLDRHGTLDHYIAIKERLFEGPGIGFCGVDDNASIGMFNRTQKNNSARSITPLSVLNQMPNGIFVTPNGNVFDYTLPNKTIHSIGSFNELPTLKGTHNFQNALFAYATTHACGCTVANIFNALKTYPGLPHRQLNVRKIGQVDYINDSKATNADASEKALKTFDNIHWIVGGLPKSGGLAGLEPLSSRISRAYLIGTAVQDFSIFMRANNIPFERANTLENAVASAHKFAQSMKKPATVLLSPACASYDQFKSYEHRGDVFTTLVQNLTLMEKSA